MAVFTVTLVAACIGFGRPGWANRWEGGALLAAFIAYSTYIVGTAAL